MDDSGVVDVDDILRVLDGFAQEFPQATLYEVDLALCETDQWVNVDDILIVLDGFAQDPYPCPDPCP